MAISGINAVSPSAAGLTSAPAGNASTGATTDASGAPVKSTTATSAPHSPTAPKQSGVTQSSPGDIIDQAIAQAEKQLAALMRQIAALKQSNMAKDVKDQMMMGLLQQTGTIQAEIQKLMAEKMQLMQAGK
jgi:hypothetical protein